MISVENLCFVDLETTGLVESQDRILEMGIIPVDPQLNLLDEGWSCLVTPLGYDLDNLGEVVKAMHTENGLLEDLKSGKALGLREAETAAIRYVEKFVPRGQTPMAGSSISFDRKFTRRYMPGFDGWFHYRDANVSSVKEFWKRWFGQESPKPEKGHRVLQDCMDSIAEARWYKDSVKFIR
jgi:oligoribonuclease